MSHLRNVGRGPIKPSPRKPRRPHYTEVFTAEEQRQARQALRHLRLAYGTWSCLAEAMGMPKESLQRAASGTAAVTAAILLRASRASGLTIDDLLSVPVPADRSRACGQIKRGSSCRGLTLRQSTRVREALRFLLAQRYQTQRELAEVIGVSQQAVSAVLSGHMLGGLKLAKGAALAMGWELDVLLNSKMPVEPPPSDPAPVAMQPT
jgi:plasmid maintenance system antidote protein VapI